MRKKPNVNVKLLFLFSLFLFLNSQTKTQQKQSQQPEGMRNKFNFISNDLNLKKKSPGNNPIICYPNIYCLRDFSCNISENRKRIFLT